MNPRIAANIALGIEVTTLLALAGIALVGCTPAQQTAPVTGTLATINADAAKAQSAVNTAVTLYGIAKGIAQVAALADPSLAPTLNGFIAATDPIIAKAPAVASAAMSDINAATALAATVTAQANALTVVAAPAIKAVPSVGP